MAPPATAWLALQAVGEELGVTRSAVYLMIRSGRLPGMQCGARWYVRREDLDEFKRTYIPAPTAGRRFGPRSGDANGTDLVLALLREWGSATSEELAEVLNRHPGNVRKYLSLLKARGLADRDGSGGWVAKAA